MRPMTVSRQLLLLLLILFLLIGALALSLIFRFAGFSAESSRLAQNLQHTVRLNHDLRRGIESQVSGLHRQFESLDPQFPLEFRKINYALGETQTEYLKLNVGEYERLTVEKIKNLQSDLGVRSLQIFDLLLIGKEQEARRRLIIVEQRADTIEEELSALSEHQLVQLRTVADRFAESVVIAQRNVFGMCAFLVLTLGALGLLLKKRVLLPLNSIVAACDRVRHGDLSVRAQFSRVDEIGQLAQGFNFMAESLAESYAGLEHKVEERTQRIQDLQEQLVQTEKMSAVGRLVGGVAHELNNPLTAIIGLTDLAKMEQERASGDSASDRAMEDIHFQADRCRRIVANLLQFSRRQKPHLEAIRINEVVEQILQLREYELETSNVKLLREYDPSNPLICADPNKIQQIALNLLNNAHDAIVDAGRPGTIWVRTSTTGEKVVLEFLDSGTGLREIDRLFEPFYTTKEAGKGTGLGLSVCYGIVQEHHGEIRAANWENGAHFTVILPIGDPKALMAVQQSTDKPESAIEAGIKPQALVVDDEEMLLRLQLTYLMKMGIQGVSASTGEEAVKYLQQHAVDLIISDLRMPGAIDGIQLLDWVRAHRPELQKRFLLVSGALMQAEGDGNSEDSVPRIQKPFTFDNYSRSVRQLLQT